ncbi:hypothetical protein [Aeromicrobium endophyticum]|uniref:Uncharacterized protein n=1 Tax=Aeromicrobium endophyticum TaxID=2292704 RepID=A0A371P3X5_9ACTN|nr:hypothetical protein [Aeromicrobium endophyticum]REK70644.1 hypothetical protein DX116_16155 [Aeromicrobium endophyticum]
MVDAQVPVVVRGASTHELAQVLAGLGLVGSVVDGAALGLDGMTVARVVGDDDVALVVAEDGTSDDVEAEAVLERLEAQWPGALWGTAAAEAHDLQWPVMGARPARTVAVTPPADLMLGVVARDDAFVLHEARVGDRLLVGIAHDHDLAADVLVHVLVNARGRSVVLWRSGGHVGLEVLKRGSRRASHVWEPGWTPFGVADDGLRDPGVTGDAAAIGSLLGLADDDVVSLRALMRREPDLDALAGLLGLPPAAVAVLEGRTTVAKLPGGRVVEPATGRDLVRQAVRPSEHDPAWMRWFDRGARELRPWYVLSSLVSVAIGVFFVASWAADGSAFFGVVGLVMAAGTVVDLAVRWWRRRARRVS